MNEIKIVACERIYFLIRFFYIVVAYIKNILTFYTTIVDN